MLESNGRIGRGRREFSEQREKIKEKNKKETPANAASPDRRTARNSRPLEVIGTYDPKPKPDPYDNSGKLHKDIKLDATRARYWIGVGAQPSEPVWRMLALVSGFFFPSL